MIKELGLPYMGSKRKLSSDLVDYILNKNQNVKYVYDLFGGGGAMSFEFIQRKRIKKVVYNELNTGVVNLLKDIKENGVDEKYLKWVGREDFDKHKNDDTWYGGFIKTCWSFGNKQTSYLFGKDLENNKRLLHNIVVFRCDESRKEFEKVTGLYIEDYYLRNNNLSKRRKEVTRLVKSCVGRFDLQQLEQLERLELSNKSYKDVVINTPIEETIIYLDPPYDKTASYEESVCHDELYEYIKNSPYKIYLSSYESPLKCVYELSHRSSLSATNNSKKVVEKLFCNQEENSYGSLF